MKNKLFKAKCILCKHMVKGEKGEACCNVEGCPQTLTLEELITKEDKNEKINI